MENFYLKEEQIKLETDQTGGQRDDGGLEEAFYKCTEVEDANMPEGKIKVEEVETKHEYCQITSLENQPEEIRTEIVGDPPDQNIKTEAFGINVETDVIEIPSEVLSNEHILKSLLYSKQLKKKKKCFRCLDCQKIFNSPSDIKRHLETHSDVKAFKCIHCETVFSRKDTLERHLLVHSNFQAFQCTMCDSAFSQKNGLERHVYTNHDPNFKPQKCLVCSREFKEKNTLTAHLRTHTGEKPFKCDICGKTFSHKTRLKSHIAVIHEGKTIIRTEKSQICQICSATFKSRAGFNQHLKLHQLKEGKLSLEHKCEICNKMFFTSGNKNRHMKTHTGQKDYQCSECGKSYTERRHLESHKEIAHDGKRNHICNDCGKTFTRSNSLKAHMLLHTGEHAIFQCDICSATYKEKRNLMNHVERVHK